MDGYSSLYAMSLSFYFRAGKYVKRDWSKKFCHRDGWGGVIRSVFE